MSSAKPVAAAEGEVLGRLTKAARNLLNEIIEQVAPMLVNNERYYRLPTLTLLELNEAVREAEKIVD